MCVKCNDTGYYFEIDEDGYEVAKVCDCGFLEKEMVERQFKYADIPEAFAEVKMNNFNTGFYSDKQTVNEMVANIQYWLDHFDEMEQQGVGLYLYSKTKGSGKTRLAASIANKLLDERHIPIKFATTTRILNEIKETWNKDAETSESTLINNLCVIKCLVIDDFGIEKPSDWVEERFYHIINERYVNNLITIYTSNSSITDLKHDDRITNRILERSIEIKFPEESVRTRIAALRQAEIQQAIRGGANI